MVTTLWVGSPIADDDSDDDEDDEDDDSEDDAATAAVNVPDDGGGGGGNGGCGGDGLSASDHLAGSVAKFGLSLNVGCESLAGGGSSGSGRDGGDGCCCCSAFTSHFAVTSLPLTTSSFVVHSLSSPAKNL